MEYLEEYGSLSPGLGLRVSERVTVSEGPARVSLCCFLSGRDARPGVESRHDGWPNARLRDAVREAESEVQACDPTPEQLRADVAEAVWSEIRYMSAGETRV